MGGCGAANRLHADGLRPVIYDQHLYHGGHTASVEQPGGFIFDKGPHISYTKNPRIQELFADSVDQKYETIQIYLNNYWRGHWPTHPVQLHLRGVPDDVAIKVITDFVAEQQAGEREITNYEDWLVASFGRAFAEQFPMQYTRKYHLTEAKNLTTDWLGPRIYRPNLEEVLRGAISSAAPNIHPYIDHFRYPTRGGFVSYLQKFVRKGELKLGHEVVSLDPRAKELTFRNGVRARYDAVVSSIPLPSLIPLIVGAPPEVREATGRLACTTCILVNIGVNRAALSKAHMTYFYDQDICFTRLGFPHMLSPNNAPAGKGSIQAEVYFSSKYRPFTGNPEDQIAPVIRDLRRCGLLQEDDEILYQGAEQLPYAFVTFDHERSAALKIVHGYLDEIGVAYCGRFGDWGYLWTDESFLSGERAAETALGSLSGASAGRS